MSSKSRSQTKAKVVAEFSGEDRTPTVEKNRRGHIRIWWGAWACTIAPNKKVRYNHLHDLTYYAGRGGERNPRCRCGETVPEELYRMAMLQRIGMARTDGTI